MTKMCFSFDKKVSLKRFTTHYELSFLQRRPVFMSFPPPIQSKKNYQKNSITKIRKIYALILTQECFPQVAQSAVQFLAMAPCNQGAQGCVCREPWLLSEGHPLKLTKFKTQLERSPPETSCKARINDLTENLSAFSIIQPNI